MLDGESGEKCKFIVSLTGAADQSADGILAVAMCVYDQHWESILQHRYTQYTPWPDLH